MSSPRSACIAAVVAFLVLDGVWLGPGGAGHRFLDVARTLQARDVGAPAAPAWGWWQLAALAVGIYALLAFALCRFVVWPARESPRPGAHALVAGALLGLVVYGTFDFTNLALFGPGYGFWFAASDAAWGAFAMAMAGALGSVFLA